MLSGGGALRPSLKRMPCAAAPRPTGYDVSPPDPPARPLPRTRVKVCCIASRGEAEAAIAHGADAVGLVSEMPTGPGVITASRVREIAAWAPPPVGTFLLTSRDRGAAIADQVGEAGVTAVQLVRHIEVREYAALIERRPQVRRVQVVHIEDVGALELIDRYAPHVHAFLLDSGRPSRQELGGTGRSHDWDISADFVRRSPRPVFLAGGLTADNVHAAIAKVRPYGLDVCSGVRTDGRLDGAKLAAFFRQVRVADAELGASRTLDG